MEIANKYNIKNMIILDLGCADATVSAHLSDNNFVIGLDKKICHKGLKSASEKGLVPILANLENDIPFKDNSFDVILCLDVVEHIKNFKLLIRESYRILKNNGLFILSTPNADSIPYKFIRFIGRDSKTHISMFGYKQIVNEIKLYFEILEQTGWTGWKIYNWWFYFKPFIMEKYLIYNNFIISKK